MDIHRGPCHRSPHGRTSFVWGQPEPLSGQSNPRKMRPRSGLQRLRESPSIASKAWCCTRPSDRGSRNGMPRRPHHVGSRFVLRARGGRVGFDSIGAGFRRPAAPKPKRARPAGGPHSLPLESCAVGKSERVVLQLANRGDPAARQVVVRLDLLVVHAVSARNTLASGPLRHYVQSWLSAHLIAGGGEIRGHPATKGRLGVVVILRVKPAANEPSSHAVWQVQEQA